MFSSQANISRKGTMMEHETEVEAFLYSDPVAQRLDAIAALAKTLGTIKDREARDICRDAMRMAVRTYTPKGEPASVSAIMGGKAG
jgi:hypothetical protein